MELNKKQNTIKYVLYCVLILLADLLQNTGGLITTIFSAHCFLLIPVTITLAMSEGEKEATLLGLFGGLLEAQQKAAREAKEQAQRKAEGIAQISIDDFAKVELRVAEVKDCEPVKRAKKLLKLTLDDGSGAPRTVASGIAQWYKPEDLIGHKVVLVANLKPAVLCGVESQGMILAADCAKDDVKVLFVDNMPAGAKIR